MSNDNFVIVLTIHGTNNIISIPNDISSRLEYYKSFESKDKIVFDVPREWSGLRDGTLIKLFKQFNEDIYVSLGYISFDDSEIITDLEGKPVDKYEIISDSKRAWKYIKKRLKVIKVLDKESEIFSVKAYSLNIKFIDPIVKILDVYSAGNESGVRLSQFIDS